MSLAGYHHHNYNAKDQHPPPFPTLQAPQQQTVTIFCKGEENYSLTVRNGEVVLATANPRNEYQQHTVRIFCKAEENYSLTIRNGEVVLAPSNRSDEYQHWIKDFRFNTTVKDEQGFPSFALVNKVTGQAIKHSIEPHHPVRLVPYNPDYLDESVLWSESKDLGDGFRCIRMVNNIHLIFDACQGDEDHGGVHDGTTLLLFEWKEGKNQRWKIVPYGQEQHNEMPPTRNPTVRIHTNVVEDYSITIRNGDVVLAPSIPRVEHQRPEAPCAPQAQQQLPQVLKDILDQLQQVCHKQDVLKCFVTSLKQPSQVLEDIYDQLKEIRQEQDILKSSMMLKQPSQVLEDIYDQLKEIRQEQDILKSSMMLKQPSQVLEDIYDKLKEIRQEQDCLECRRRRRPNRLLDF